MKIALASSSLTEMLQPWVDKILQALGFEEALVTDLSSISDFSPTKDELRQASNLLGIELSSKMYLWEAAGHLKIREDLDELKKDPS